jgi:asparaginyl-tRNA synthetase
MSGTTIREAFRMNPEEQRITVRGWIRTKRESKTFCFLELNDGSVMKNFQIVYDASSEGYEALLPRLTTGASLIVTGRLVASQGKGQTVELKADEVQVVGDSPADTYPLQKKRHSFEFLREIAHLRPRTNTFGAVARVRNAMSYAIHRFFQEKGFLYVHTPIITSSDCEGAGEMFQVTTLPLDKIPDEQGSVDYSQDFFGKRTGLTVSGQLEAELYACALGNVYTFGPTFRAEHSNTTRHLAEFWMIEPEMAFCDIHGNMDLAEEFLKYIFRYTLESCPEDIEFFDKWIDKSVIATIQNVTDSDFERITYTEAIDRLEKSDQGFEFPVSWGIDLQSEHERYLTETVYKKPVIIIDYPKEIKAFYMKLGEDDKTVRAMDILVPRLGEIVGGSEREADHDILVNRIREMDLNPDEYWWYLEIRRFGTVPHSGFGLGFERLIQFMTGMKNIRDVIPFPRSYREIEF